MLKGDEDAILAASVGNSLSLWLDANDISTLTTVYNNMTETVSGTISTNTLTASADVSAKLQTGNYIRVNGTDIYTVASVSTVTITTVETLTSTYAALTVLARREISQWNDKSVNANHVTQGTATNQPQVITSGQNNKGILYFDGADRLQLPAALLSIPNGPSTLFIVCKQATGGVQAAPFEMNASGSGRYNLLFLSTSGSVNFTSRAGGTGVTITGVTPTNFNIFNGRRSGTTEAISYNGGSETSDANAADEASITAGSVGGITGLSFTGSIAEVILYNRSLSALEIFNINKKLSYKWGVTLS